MSSVLEISFMFICVYFYTKIKKVTLLGTVVGAVLGSEDGEDVGRVDGNVVGASNIPEIAKVKN